jgi:uncharacterized protein YjbI with pentapeptide repeats
MQITIACEGITVNKPAIQSRNQELWRSLNWYKPADEREKLLKCEETHIFCLLLAAHKFNLTEAKVEAVEFGIDSDRFDIIKNDLVQEVSEDGYAVQLKPASFLGTDIVSDPKIKNLLEKAIKNTPDCLRWCCYLGDLEFANLQKAMLESADMRGACFSSTDLREAILDGANLQQASLPGTELDGASLRGANLRKAKVFGCSFEGADLEGADLREAFVFYNPGLGNWKKSNLWGADLCGAGLIGCDLEGSDLSLTDVSGAKFTESECYGVNWSLAFYNVSNPPQDLRVNKDKLLALDEESYESAKRLQEAYRDSLKSSNNNDIKKAKNEFKDFLSNIAYQKYKENPRQYIESHSGITDLPWDHKKNRFEYVFVKGVPADVRNAKYGDDKVLKTLSDVLEMGNRVLQSFGLNR